MRVVLDGGETIELGAVEATSTVSITDFSRRETDDFGVTTVVPRGFARRMSVKLVIAPGEVDALQRTLANLRATPAMWIADEQFGSLSFRGFYKDFEIDLAGPPFSYCTLTVEGLVVSEPSTDTGIDPAPYEQVSTLQLLQPAIVEGTALVSSTVPENDYPLWAAGTTYAVAARVILAATHRIYESAVDGNVGNDPAGISGKWIDIGPTNRWAMFDQALGSATTRQGSIKVDLAAGMVDAVALLDVTPGSTVRVQATGYDRTQTAIEGAAVTFLDLPGSGDPVGVTISGTGQVAVGTLLVGRLVNLGLTEASPTAGITDFSRKETDEFGEVTVVPRAWAKRMNLSSVIRTDALDIVAGRIAAVRALPSLWIGADGLDSLTVYGFFKDFSIAVAEGVSKLSLSIEGLSTAGKVEPLTASVAWPDITDPDGTKPQDNADVTSENTSKDTAAVGGVPAPAVINKLTQLDTAQALALIDIAKAKQDIDNLQDIAAGDLSGLLDDIEQLQTEAADIRTQVLAAVTDINSVENTVSVQGAAITTLQTAATGAAGSIATLQQTVSTQGSSITTNAQAITSLNGTVATLGTTVSSQGSSISVLQSASSTQSGEIATLKTRVSAGSTNLIPNGSYEQGTLAGWTPIGPGWGVVKNSSWGSFAVTSTNIAHGAYSYLESQQVPIESPDWYTFASDIGHFQVGYGEHYLGIAWYDANHVIIGSPVLGAIRPSGSNFDATTANRTDLAVTALSPAGAAYASGLAVFHKINGEVQLFLIRQCKLERGRFPTAYSAEASITQTFTALSTQAGNLASLTTTVATQGSIVETTATAVTTLNGNFATLSQTVSTLGSSVTTQAQAITTLQGRAATLETRVTAGSANLLVNGGLDRGLEGWSGSAALDIGYSGAFGRYLAISPGNSASFYVNTPKTQVEVGRVYTGSIDSQFLGTAGGMVVSLIFLNSGGGEIARFKPADRGGHGFDNANSNRAANAATGTAPAGTTDALIQVSWFGVAGITSAALREAKIEAFSTWTPYSSEAAVRQSFEALSNLTTQYASLSSEVAVQGASVTVQQSAISVLQSRTTAFFRVDAVAGDNTAYLSVFADANAGGEVVIGSNLRVHGDAMIDGTINPEALALGRFVRRGYAEGSGSPNAGQTLLLGSIPLGPTAANGSYSLEIGGGLTTNVGVATGSFNGKPLSINYIADGGFLIQIVKNGTVVALHQYSASEYVGAPTTTRVLPLNANHIFDAPAADTFSGDVVVNIYAIRGSVDTGNVNEGDSYSRNVSATYSGVNASVKAKWTFI